MATNEQDLFEAARTVYDALQPLDEPSRSRVLSSVISLLGMEITSGVGLPPLPATARAQLSGSAVATTGRPVSLVELMEEKQPSTSAQRIALFAYYRERVEGLTRFSRADLKDYFARAKLQPPSNYDRDFTTAVKYGWIHEDGSESYLTTKGIEAVESAFTQPVQPRKRKASRKTSTKAKRPSRTGRKG